MSNELANILQNSAALVQTGLDEDTLAVAGGGGNQTKRLSIKGGVFRKMSGGKEIGAIEDRHMNVIIVKMAHDASRTYYASAYKKGVKLSPACWSNDSKTPDAEVEAPQASTCAECPQSVKGSGQGGMGTCAKPGPVEKLITAFITGTATRLLQHKLLNVRIYLGVGLPIGLPMQSVDRLCLWH